MDNLRVFKIEGFNYLKMLVQKYRKKRLTLETALYVQMTTSLVSKRVSHDCSMTCHFLVHQPNIYIFKVTCSFFISFGLLAGSSWMYVFIRPVGP